MMKHLHYFQILFFIGLLLGCQKLKAQLLWEISGNELTTPSYLYGTMHISDERVFQFTDSVMITFESCDAFVGELKLDSNPLALSLQMYQHLFMKGDTTLEDLLDKQRYQFIIAQANRKLNIGEAFIKKIKPIFISVMLTDTEIIASDRPPLDLYFQEIAAKRNMEVIGLETIEEQVSAFNAIALKEQAEMLYEDLKNPRDSKESTEHLIQLYTAQSLDSLHTITQADMSKEVQQALLIKRNFTMGARIEGIIQKKKAFIGIGAAHLPGMQGVVSILRKRGYKVRPII